MSILLRFDTDHRFYWLCSCIICSLGVLVLFVAAQFTYVYYNIFNICWMREKHNFTYKSHAPRQVPLVVLTAICTFFEICREYQWTSFRICQLVYMDSELEEYTGYCNTLMSISIQPKVGTTQMFWLVAWVVIGLFPI